MRGFFVFLVLLAAGVVALGLYLDWFSFSKSTDAGNRTHIDLTIDKDRIKEDADHARDRLKNLGESARDAVREPGRDKP